MRLPDTHLLEIDSVELQFGDRRILSGVYMAVETGWVTAVLGRNGCGKSCLMKILFGTLGADFKSMRIDGLWHDRFTAEEVLYLPQQGFIPRHLTAGQVLRDFGLVWDELVEWFPIFEKFRDSKLCEMSGGEGRILECYVILRGRAQFALLDEPFSQIAPLHIMRLKELIGQEKQSKGILLTDHMWQHVTDIADRLYIMANGQAYLAQSDEDMIRYGYLKQF